MDEIVFDCVGLPIDCLWIDSLNPASRRSVPCSVAFVPSSVRTMFFFCRRVSYHDAMHEGVLGSSWGSRVICGGLSGFLGNLLMQALRALLGVYWIDV